MTAREQRNTPQTIMANTTIGPLSYQDCQPLRLSSQEEASMLAAMATMAIPSTVMNANNNSWAVGDAREYWTTGNTYRTSATPKTLNLVECLLLLKDDEAVQFQLETIGTANILCIIVFNACGNETTFKCCTKDDHADVLASFTKSLTALRTMPPPAAVPAAPAQ